MKTALCISGQISRVAEDSESVRTMIIEPLMAGVFCSMWTPDNLRHEFCMKPEHASVDELIKAYNPRLLEIEHPNSPHIQEQLNNLPDVVFGYDEWKKGSKKKSPGTKIFNIWNMWYRVWKANELSKLYEQINGFTYDRIIRFRCQIALQTPLPDFIPEPNTIYIPIGQDHLGGLCDTLAIGDRKAMDIYCGIYPMLEAYRRLNYPLHQESVLKLHLELNNINVERISVDTTLRGNAWNNSLPMNASAIARASLGI